MNDIELRGYQDRCIRDTLDNIKEGRYRQLISLPTGSGKTVIMSRLIPLIPPPDANATKVLVLANRIELIRQAKAMISKMNPKLTVQTEQGSNHCCPALADVIVASVQSLNSTHPNDESKLHMEKFNRNDFKVVIVDEAHHAVSPTYMRVFEHFGVLNDSFKVLLWGCTATPNQTDKVSLEPIFGPVCSYIGMMKLIEHGYLCDLRVTTVDTDDLMDDDTFHKVVIHSWKEFAQQKNRKATLVFARNILQTEALCEDFIDEGIDARFITSDTDGMTRASIIEDFKSGKLPVLVNCGILTEGADLPRVDCILLARKTNSETWFQQMLGRGSRLHEGKQDCLVIDFKKNFERLFDGMMSHHGELDETLDSKKTMAKKTNRKKNANQKDLEDNKTVGEDSLATIRHYKSLKDYMEGKQLVSPPQAGKKGNITTNRLYKKVDEAIILVKKLIAQQFP